MQTGTLIATIEPSGRRGADSPGTPIRAVASTENVARDGGVLLASGWRLENFNDRNPIVLVNHNYASLPVGRAKAAVEGRRLVADVTFDLSDPVGQALDNKYRTGFMHSFSVGWESKRMAPANYPMPAGAKWVSLSHELLDLSAVSCPSDVGAVIQRSLAARSQQSLTDTRWCYGMARKMAPGGDPAEWAALAGKVRDVYERSLAQVKWEEEKRGLQLSILRLMLANTLRRLGVR